MYTYIYITWAVERESVHIFVGPCGFLLASLGRPWFPRGPRGSPKRPRGALMVPKGIPRGPKGSPWVDFGAHLAPFGLPLGPLGAPWAA